jgi:hypothetical protein
MATQPLNSAEVQLEEAHHLQLKPPLEAGSLAMQRAPEIVLEEAARAAQALRQIIEQKPRKVVLNGKTYLQFEDWQTLGRFYGVTAVGRATNPVNYGKVQGFECHAEALLVSSNQVISRAEAMCLDDEQNWTGKPLYQLRSMAQTRACAKALRNVLAWVVVLAGYSPTPAEEMDSPRGVAFPQNGGGRLSGDRIEEMLGEIRRASTMEQLRTVYTFAYREADQMKDRRAMAAYIVAKDARKRELQ